MGNGRTPRAAAAFTVSDVVDDNEATSPHVKLLADIREVFNARGSSFIKSQTLCAYLRSMEESPWETWELTPSRLGHRLEEYGLETGHNLDRTERGYRLVDFLNAFAHYLPPLPERRPNPSNPARTSLTCANSRTPCPSKTRPPRQRCPRITAVQTRYRRFRTAWDGFPAGRANARSVVVRPHRVSTG